MSKSNEIEKGDGLLRHLLSLVLIQREDPRSVWQSSDLSSHRAKKRSLAFGSNRSNDVHRRPLLSNSLSFGRSSSHNNKVVSHCKSRYITR